MSEQASLILRLYKMAYDSRASSKVKELPTETENIAGAQYLPLPLLPLSKGTGTVGHEQGLRAAEGLAREQKLGQAS